MPTSSRSIRKIGLLGLAVSAALAFGAAVWRGERLGIFTQMPVAIGETPVKVTIGSDTLTVPANLMRFADQRHDASYPRVELELTWPELRPLGSDDPALATTGRDGRLVFVTFEPRDTDLDTADRIATIYQKFLAPEPILASDSAGPDGLERRSFLPGTSYEGEALYFEPGSVHPFAARCFPISKGEQPITCLRDVRLGTHLLATIRFPVAALADWRRLRDRIDGILADVEGARG